MKKRSLFLTGALLCSVVACSGLSKKASAPENAVTFLHINDHHSKLNPTTLKLKVEGAEQKIEVGGFPRVVTKLNELVAKNKNVVKVHAGDALTGDLFFVLFEGQAEADLMQEACFDVFTIGNHEFDKGDKGLKKFIDYLAKGKCPPVILGANIQPKVGKSPLTPKSAWDHFKPYTIKEVGGQKIGLIGLTVAKKTKESSSPDADTKLLEEVATAQKYIDELEAQGIKRIVLVTHMGIENDVPMVKKLRGVDVVIGGDSHTLLGSELSALGLSPEGEYPIKLQDADGKLACVAQAWEYSLVVGELHVVWNDAGEVTDCMGTPHLLKDVTPDQATLDRLAKYSKDVDAMKNNVVASSRDDLCLVRIPGEKRSQICTPEQTKKHGSDVATVVVQSFREQSKLADIALQNGGGVRTDLAKGQVTLGDVYKVLPFSNTLVNLTMTGSEIAATIEEAVDFALMPNGSTGAYPYAAGLRFHVDSSKAKGSRVTKYEVKSKKTNKWQPMMMNKNYIVAANDYIAKGKDGFGPMGEVSKSGRVENTYLDLAQAFADYLKKVKTIKKLPYSEYSTQSYK